MQSVIACLLTCGYGEFSGVNENKKIVSDNDELIKNILFFTNSPLLLIFYLFTIIAHDFLIFIHTTELAIPIIPLRKSLKLLALRERCVMT